MSLLQPKLCEPHHRGGEESAGFIQNQHQKKELASNSEDTTPKFSFLSLCAIKIQLHEQFNALPGQDRTAAHSEISDAWSLQQLGF